MTNLTVFSPAMRHRTGWDSVETTNSADPQLERKLAALGGANRVLTIRLREGDLERVLAACARARLCVNGRSRARR